RIFLRAFLMPFYSGQGSLHPADRLLTVTIGFAPEGGSVPGPVFPVNICTRIFTGHSARFFH
ncbi:hypothetical protein DKU11_23645, partial [Salmonella enterica subsp. enterica serovar Kintambo]|nr:hypothetical protein [Salmonella enterica subsp. enterica serovar Kintambo]